ncbi:nucleoside monophosphate kinase [Candidatus Uhrbacteria bacterium]|nr:nucleoside monophosphate kinase [Candidatus Uhrbacteria bacterium]
MSNPSSILRLVVLGPQGAGKGTQAEILAERLHIPTISPGMICREAVTKQTSLGLEIERYVKSGQLVPDILITQIMQDRLSQPDALEGWIADAYPRDHAQLEGMLSFTQPSHALVLQISDEEAIDRLEGRRECAQCKHNYHVRHVPPAIEGVCDRCEGVLLRRDDDYPEAIRKRLEIYHTQTEPILERFEGMGILCRVDGSGGIDAVARRVAACLGMEPA